MGQTITEKIFSEHVGHPVYAGEIVRSPIDMVIGNDITTPISIKAFEDSGATALANPDGFSIVLDHFIPAKDIASANQARISRDFAKKHEMKNFFDEKDMGIEHALLPEKGLVVPGDVIIGADSHTCTYGAVGAFATGVGGTDLGASMATGDTWFKVPSTIKVELTGAMPEWVSGKDVILTLIGLIGVDGARYQALEFTGPGVANLSMADRFTISNMAVEAGGKNGIFPVDEKTVEYLRARTTKPYTIYSSDPDAVYAREIKIDLASLRPVVALPHLPENVKPVSELTEIIIDQVVIGSCTNGRIDDLEQAAKIIAGRKIHPAVRAIIIPGTQEVYMEAMKRGYIAQFIEAGAVVSTPTCGPCLGGYMGILAAGERCVSTTNRNFRGRMGHVDSEVYLASPAVAAASAILGRIAEPKEVLA